MKVNRRRLFGVGAGAAVAGPSVLGEIAAAAGTLVAGVGTAMPPSTPAPYYGDSLVNKVATDPNYAARRIAQLKRIIAGDFDEGEGGNLRDYPTAAAYLGPFDPLKSVSKSAARFLTRRLEETQHRERLVRDAIKELARLDPTGIVRAVL